MKLLSLVTLTFILSSGSAKAADFYEANISMSLEAKNILDGSKYLLQDLPMEVDMYAAEGACVLRVMNKPFTCIHLNYVAGEKPEIFIQIPKLLSLLEFLFVQGSLPLDQFQKMKDILILRSSILSPASLIWGFELENGYSDLFEFSFKLVDVRKLREEGL